MDMIVERLLRGSTEIDRMRGEIRQVTGMLFGLARTPGLWIHARRLEGKWNNFFTRFGEFDKTECVWDVWWEPPVFQTRCLFLSRESPSLVSAGRAFVHVYGSRAELPVDTAKSFSMEYLETAAGILVARRKLEVFVQGMMDEFPLSLALKPFLQPEEIKV